MNRLGIWGVGGVGEVELDREVFKMKDRIQGGESRAETDQGWLNRS